MKPDLIATTVSTPMTKLSDLGPPQLEQRSGEPEQRDKWICATEAKSCDTSSQGIFHLKWTLETKSPPQHWPRRA